MSDSEASAAAHHYHHYHHEASHKEHQKLTEKKDYIANQYRIFSITYGIFFCLTGIVLTSVEPFKACKQKKMFIYPKTYYFVIKLL
jgi:hypothetical protein